MSTDALTCRVCLQPLFAKPLLELAGMPSAAQGFPDAGMLEQDRPEDLHIHQCSSCGLVQLPGPAVAYHREVIRSAAFSAEMRAFRQQQFAGWVKRLGLAGRTVLEIGCGRGEYLEILREAGANAAGIEYAEAAAGDCRARGLPVERGYPQHPGTRFANAPFDAFAVFNFLEHWPDPVGSLRCVADNLTPAGVGLVEVPNFDMILRQGLFSEFIRDHLLYFTEDSLRFTLMQAGFEVIDCTSVWHDYILSANVRRRTPLDTGLLDEQRRALHTALHEFLAGFAPRTVAVWGAGHQALAVIALTGIAGRIRYVVDSAPFKQGRFTPATHLPIVPPDVLRTDPVAAVIVMAAAYSDEVVTILRNEYPEHLQIAVLRDRGLERP